MIKQVATISLAAGAMLSLSLLITPKSALASTWHSGTPKVLRGNWRTKSFKSAPNMMRQYIHMHKNDVLGMGKETYKGHSTLDNARPIIQKAKYKYLGHKTYYIKDLKTGYTDGHDKFKLINRHTLKLYGEKHYYYKY